MPTCFISSKTARVFKTSSFQLMPLDRATLEYALTARVKSKSMDTLSRSTKLEAIINYYFSVQII